MASFAFEVLEIARELGEAQVHQSMLLIELIYG